MSVTARDLMTGDLLRARLDWTLTELTAFLTKNSISGAPVVSDEGRLVGVVSLTDVARPAANGGSAKTRTHDDYLDGPAYFFESRRTAPPRRDKTVAEIMTPHVFDVPATASVPEIAEAMLRGRIHRVFVVEGDMVVGVISALDLLRVLV
jgi:CBS domain-containing protein